MLTLSTGMVLDRRRLFLALDAMHAGAQDFVSRQWLHGVQRREADLADQDADAVVAHGEIVAKEPLNK